ncbi:MAG TPA: hypothetical protein VHA52_12540, partial [Candidatus Babeliaceae bacterium]|nr:hypothetical protein [Candidatus Babeliaceae bacterium]
SRDSGSLWPHEIIARDFRSSAVAVQRRNAMTMIAGRCLAIGRADSLCHIIVRLIWSGLEGIITMDKNSFPCKNPQ